MTLRAGQLKNRVEIYQYTQVKDDLGAVKDVKEFVGGYYAAIDHLYDRSTGQLIGQSQSTIKVTIRYNRDVEKVTNAMFIKFRDQIYDIESVINRRMLNESLVITATLKGD